MAWFADWRNRRTLRRARRTLDIAQTPAWVGNWATTQSSLNSDIYLALAPAVARSRGLARNNDYARGFFLQLKTNVLGPAGIRLQMRVTKRGDQPNDTVNDAVEAAWRAWGRRGGCEVTGRLTWREIERLLLEGLARDGEILVRKLPGRGPHRFQLQILDPLLLDPTYNDTLADGRRVRMGVEIDADGAPLAYWLRNGGHPELELALIGYHSGDRVRVPASEMLHAFIAEEPAQLRGYPWLASGARRLFLVRDYEDAASVAAANAAKRVGFFVSPTGEAPPGFADQIVSSVLEQAKAAGKVLTPEEVQALVAVAEKYTTTAPGQYDTLPVGYDFRPFESKHPHEQHGDFIKACLRGVATGLGRSYVTLGNDLESVNYSSARVGILDERETYKSIQQWLCEAVHDTVFADWLRYALIAAPQLVRIDPTKYEALIEASTWQQRRWAGIDPNKEASAAETNLKLKLTSRRRLILERGEDPDEVFAEIEAEAARFGPVETAPAAPAKEPDDDDEQTVPRRAALRAIAGA